ncbi:hypothetical protein MHYP_G00230410 [Metynnis hypsauchen]
MLHFLLLLGCLVTLKGQSAAAEGSWIPPPTFHTQPWALPASIRKAQEGAHAPRTEQNSAEKPADPCAKGPSITTTQLLTTPAAQLTSTSQPRNFTPVAAATVKMRSFTELSNDAIITFIDKFARQIQARVNETIKMTVKKITRVTP